MEERTNLDGESVPELSTQRSDAHTGPAVLIGTGRTVGLLAAQLSVLPDPPRAAGCVLVEPVPAGGRSHPVLGSLEDLPSLHSRHGFALAVVSLPASMRSEILRVRAALAALGIPERFVPPLPELLAHSPGAAAPVAPGGLDMVELIGRTPYGIDRKAVARIFEGRTVLVTGAGGSIGSELVRIAATFHPACIVLMERSENSLFEIDRQLSQRFPGVQRRAVLHDVVDAERTLRLLVDLRPDVVFHAAAHKHVPLMEDHPSHAVDNNFFGTKSIADASLAVGASRFVLISSDKAVNPASVMGATKRLAEMYVRALHARSRAGPARAGATRFCSVRFGNVLGSACSVLPIWATQIAEGGPITVTDERMTRYFMTIHEAATLVIQGAAMCPDSADSEVYVLDMGEPVRILDLARRLVAAHGYEPVVKAQGVGRDVEGDVEGVEHRPEGRCYGHVMEIALTGARPGEKLHEELAYAAEQLRATDHPGINAWAGLDEELNPAAMVADLSAVRGSSDRETVLRTIGRYIPTLVSATADDVRHGTLPARRTRETKQNTIGHGAAA